MLIRKSGRPLRRLSAVGGGDGEITLHDLATPETLPKNLRVLAEVTLRPGESVGHHRHADESEIYLCICGEGQIYDDGEEVTVYPGDTVVAPAGAMHGLKNLGLDDFKLLAVVVRDG